MRSLTMPQQITRASLFDRALSWLYIRRIWGDRCSDYEPTCPSCRRWAEHDWLFGDGEHPDERARGDGT